MHLEVKQKLRMQADELIKVFIDQLTTTLWGRLLILFAISRIIYTAWPRKSLKGKTILITGGSGGLGKEIAIQAAHLGANVVLWDINQVGLVTTAAEIEGLGLGTKVHHFVVDVSKPEHVYEMAQKTREAAGFIYCLINNAGIVSGKYLLETSEQQIQRVFAVNVLAHFWTVKAFLPEMIERDEGHICTIASAAGLLGAPQMVDYSASKFAAVGFDESLRQEIRKMGKKNIRTTIICPAHIDTALFKGYNPGYFQRSLNPQYAALKVLESIQKNKEVVYMPRLVYVAHFLKTILPTFLHDVSMLTAGTGKAMDSFQGNSDK